MAKKSLSSKKYLKNLFSKSEANLKESVEKDDSGNGGGTTFKLFKWKKKKKTDKPEETPGVVSTEPSKPGAVEERDGKKWPDATFKFGTAPRSKKGLLSYSETDLRKPKRSGTLTFGWRKKKKRDGDLSQSIIGLHSPGSEVTGQREEQEVPVDATPLDTEQVTLNKRVKFEMSEPDPKPTDPPPICADQSQPQDSQIDSPELDEDSGLADAAPATVAQCEETMPEESCNNATLSLPVPSPYITNADSSPANTGRVNAPPPGVDGPDTVPVSSDPDLPATDPSLASADHYVTERSDVTLTNGHADIHESVITDPVTPATDPSPDTADASPDAEHIEPDLSNTVPSSSPSEREPVSSGASHANTNTPVPTGDDFNTDASFCNTDDCLPSADAPLSDTDTALYNSDPSLNNSKTDVPSTDISVPNTVTFLLDTDTFTNTEMFNLNTDISVSDKDTPIQNTDTSLTHTDSSLNNTDTVISKTEADATNTDTSVSTMNSSIPSTDITIPSTDVTIPYTDITIPNTDVTIPSTDITIPSTDVTIPSTDITIPSTDVTIPYTDITIPNTDITIPNTDITDITIPNTDITDITIPNTDITDITIPNIDITIPSKDITILNTDITIPKTDTSIPNTEISINSSSITDVTIPSTDVTISNTDIIDFTIPCTEITIPNTDTSIPNTAFTIPNIDITVPNTNITIANTDITIPSKDITIPNTDITIPNTDITIPNPDITIPNTDITIPNTDITIPKTDITIPNTDITIPKTDITIPKTDITIPNTDNCLTSTNSSVKNTDTCVTNTDTPASQAGTTVPTMFRLPTNTDTSVPSHDFNLICDTLYTSLFPQRFFSSHDLPISDPKPLERAHLDSDPVTVDSSLTNTITSVPDRDSSVSNTETFVHNTYTSVSNDDSYGQNTDSSVTNTVAIISNTDTSLPSTDPSLPKDDPLTTEDSDIEYTNSDTSLSNTAFSMPATDSNIIYNALYNSLFPQEFSLSQVTDSSLTNTHTILPTVTGSGQTNPVLAELVHRDTEPVIPHTDSNISEPDLSESAPLNSDKITSVPKTVTFNLNLSEPALSKPDHLDSTPSDPEDSIPELSSAVNDLPSTEPSLTSTDQSARLETEVLVHDSTYMYSSVSEMDPSLATRDSLSPSLTATPLIDHCSPETHPFPYHSAISDLSTSPVTPGQETETDEQERVTQQEGQIKEHQLASIPEEPEDDIIEVTEYLPHYRTIEENVEMDLDLQRTEDNRGEEEDGGQERKNCESHEVAWSFVRDKRVEVKEHTEVPNKVTGGEREVFEVEKRETEPHKIMDGVRQVQQERREVQERGVYMHTGLLKGEEGEKPSQEPAPPVMQVCGPEACEAAPPSAEQEAASLTHWSTATHTHLWSEFRPSPQQAAEITTQGDNPSSGGEADTVADDAEREDTSAHRCTHTTERPDTSTHSTEGQERPDTVITTGRAAVVIGNGESQDSVIERDVTLSADQAGRVADHTQATAAFTHRAGPLPGDSATEGERTEAEPAANACSGRTRILSDRLTKWAVDNLSATRLPQRHRSLDDPAVLSSAVKESDSESLQAEAAPESDSEMNSGFGVLSTTFTLRCSPTQEGKDDPKRVHKVSLVSSGDSTEPNEGTGQSTLTEPNGGHVEPVPAVSRWRDRYKGIRPEYKHSFLTENTDTQEPSYLYSPASLCQPPVYTRHLNSPGTLQEAEASALSPETPRSPGNSSWPGVRSEVQLSGGSDAGGRGGVEPAAPAGEGEREGVREREGEREREREIYSGWDSHAPPDCSLPSVQTDVSLSGVFKATRVELLPFPAGPEAPPEPEPSSPASPHDMDSLVGTLKSMDRPMRRNLRGAPPTAFSSLAPIVEDAPCPTGCLSSAPSLGPKENLNGKSSLIASLGMGWSNPKDMRSPLAMMKQQQLEQQSSEQMGRGLRASASGSIVMRSLDLSPEDASMAQLNGGVLSPSRLDSSLIFTSYKTDQNQNQIFNQNQLAENGKPAAQRSLFRTASLPETGPTHDRISAAPKASDPLGSGTSRYERLSFIMSPASSLSGPGTAEHARMSKPPAPQLNSHTSSSFLPPLLSPSFSQAASFPLPPSFPPPSLLDLHPAPLGLQRSLSSDSGSPLANANRAFPPDPEPEKNLTPKYRAFPDAYLTKEKEHGKLNPRPGKIFIYDQTGMCGQRIEVRGDVIDATSWELQESISIRVVRGGWVLYEKPNFKGEKIALDEGDIELTYPFSPLTERQEQNGGQETEAKPDRKFVIGSVRRAVRDYSVPEISLFPEEKAEGKKIIFRDTSEDARIFGFPIKANSIIINAGLWLVYAEPFFQGIPRVLEVGGFTNPAAWGVTQPYVGSLHPLKIGEPRVEKPNEPKLVIYDRPYFTGKSRNIYTNMRDFMTRIEVQQTAFMYSVGSIKVEGGIWVGYEKEGFRGHQYLLEEGEYHDWRVWGGFGSELRSIRLIRADLSEPVMVLYEMPEEEEEGVEEHSFEVTEAIPDVELFEFRTMTRSIHVLSGAWVAYSHVDFSGDQYILEKGFYNNCADWGAGSNRICSLQPILQAPSEGPGFTTELLLYSETDFQGDCRSCDQNQETLPDNCTLKSCRVLGGSWVAYEGTKFSGNLYILLEGDYPNFTSMGCPPDCVIRSLKTVPLMFAVPSISVFGLECFEGREVTVDTEVLNMLEEGFNNMVLSVRVNSGCWVLCEHSNYRGRQFLLEPIEITNWHKFSQLSTIGSMYPIRQKRRFFRVKNKELGHFLSIQGGVEDIKSGRVVVTEQVEGMSDIWFYQDGFIKNKLAATMSLQVMGNVEAGAKVVLWSETRMPLQTWTTQLNGTITSLTFPGMVLDMKGGKMYDRDHVVIREESDERPCQQWDLELL